MTKKKNSYNDLKQSAAKLQCLYDAQLALVVYELNDVKQELSLTIKVVDYLKKVMVVNKENPALQATAKLLIDYISDKTASEDAGFMRRNAIPFILKNYISHLIPN